MYLRTNKFVIMLESVGL